MLEVQPPDPSDAKLRHEIEKEKIAVAREELQMTYMLRKHEPIADMSKAMESFAKAKALGEQAGMKQMESMMKQIEAQTKAAMDEQKHWQGMMFSDKQMEVESAKIKAHEARVNATNQSAADQHDAAKQAQADKHSAALEAQAPDADGSGAGSRRHCAAGLLQPGVN